MRPRSTFGLAVTTRAAIAVVAITIAAGLIARSGPSRADKPEPSIDTVTAVQVTAKPINGFNKLDRARTKFGKLVYRGGLVLTAPATRAFGGWSGVVTSDDGAELFAVSDAGTWMTARLTYNGQAPSGLADVRMGPLKSFSGKPLTRGRDRDAEAVALVRGSPAEGTIQVAFERNHRIALYDIGANGVSPTKRLSERPVGSVAMKSNTGFEAMTVMRSGALKGATIAFSEQLYDAKRNHTGWIWTAKGPREFHMTNIADFDVTDMTASDDGYVYVLERRFRWLEGVKMRLRRIKVGDIQAGEIIAGEVLIEADLDYEIDNMEAIGVARGKNGETLLTLMSDDNFNDVLQRTVLLQFAVTDGGKNDNAPRGK